MANLIIKPSAGGQLIIKDEGDSAAITVGTTGQATFAENATLSGTGNALGTVATGNLSNSAIVMPRFKEIDDFYDNADTVSTTSSQTALNISHAQYVTITPEHAGDILEFGWHFNIYKTADGYGGIGIQRDDNTDFSSPTPIWSSGQHALGITGFHYFREAGIHTTTCSGLSVGTPYYFRMFGMTHSPTVSILFGGNTSNSQDGIGIRMNVKRWSIV